MRALIQRVTSADVTVDERQIARIDTGLLVLLGVAQADTAEDARRLADKVLGYRVFSDDAGRMNLSVQGIEGEVLVVSQFTLVADTAKGTRPGFSTAADPAVARSLYELFVAQLRAALPTVATGSFGADMQVTLTNAGPATFMLET